MKDLSLTPPDVSKDDVGARMFGTISFRSPNVDERSPAGSPQSGKVDDRINSCRLNTASVDNDDDPPPEIHHLSSPRAESATIPLDPKAQLTADDIRGDKTQQRQRVKSDASICYAFSNAARARELDLVHHIQGMYRLLDLISKQGSGGFVDKVIIDQEHVSRFINNLSPGAYRDITIVDFASMDRVNTKPLGVYGSKQEIVRFLKHMGAVNETIEKLLLAPQDTMTGVEQPSLRPGLYALTLQAGFDVHRLLIIFWPEDTTWDDDAVLTVRRNRITFMTYLTKITAQILALISKDHCEKLVWSDKLDEGKSAESFDEEEKSDRIFPFKVKKASEPMENIELREGFSFKSPHILNNLPPEGVQLDERRLHARLVVGDCRQGILTVEYRSKTFVTESIREEFSTMSLKSFLSDPSVSIRIGPALSDEDLSRLSTLGLKSVYKDIFEAWECRAGAIASELERMKSEKAAHAEKATKADADKMKKVLEWYVLTRVLRHYPNLEVSRLRVSKSDSTEERVEQEAFLERLVDVNPSIRTKLHETLPEEAFTKVEANFVKLGAYTKAKRIVCEYMYITQRYRMSDSEKQELLGYIENEDLRAQNKLLQREENGEMPQASVVNSLRNVAGSAVACMISTDKGTPARRAAAFVRRVSDKRYVEQLDLAVSVEPLIKPHVERSMTYLYENLALEAKKRLKRLIASVKYILRKAMHEEAINSEIVAEEEKLRRASRVMLTEELLQAYKPDDECDHIATLLDMGELRAGVYSLLIDHHTRTGPRLHYTMYPLSLTEHDPHITKMEPSHVPQPNVAESLATSFNLLLNYVIIHFQPLECGKALLILDREGESLYVYLEDTARLDEIVRKMKHKKLILREKLGRDVILAYDEQKRMLVVCGVDVQNSSIQLHSFVFDENYTQLDQGSTVNLRSLYTKIPMFQNMLFISGTDDLALVEDTGNVRIFSLLNQKFRPTSLQLEEPPIATRSTPDGSCLVAMFENNGQLMMRAYDWTSFGSYEGFSFRNPVPLDTPVLVTSFGQRSSVHLLTLDSSTHSCCSLVMDITRQATESRFGGKSLRRSQKDEQRTFHNSLIDCHSEVWPRFPNTPAVQRHAIVSESIRKDRYLLFVAPEDHAHFEPYFEALIQKHKNTKKPIGNIFTGLIVVSGDFTSTLAALADGTVWDSVSTFKSGEWVADIFCLIPIHLAITRENGFVDAEMGRISDTLPLGWYEGIFQSYMPMRPVKVVSSMDEQSVGKSFALDRLVDTSSAGSAMQTTEGVWMSVAPTESHLIVTLDFEGVRSIERSVQDTLLVSFNAAISSLNSRLASTRFDSLQGGSSADRLHIADEGVVIVMNSPTN